MTARGDRPTYPEIGATAGPLPDGYDRAVRSRVIGSGEEAFHRAADRLLGWQLQRRAGAGFRADSATAVPGARVSVRVGWGPVGITAPCEVVYVVNEPRRRGFAYGTLPGHPVRGEEYFGVEWRDDDTVLLTIKAFSRPATWWARAGAPVARRAQRRITDRYLRSLDDCS
ncbi:DUF1990 domain-containing protein [Rhodococcus sp. HM1]|uniref:DUF1990 family protein n=1 Tax=unclassified Rhodococcus (in: high G+C Gram-positive bacteria) TaxID=192944 RepID=UPI0018CE3FD2|nr:MULTISPECIES: DUF1990 domain-containing protein [unclassified Rhodococcus (in: high G+C Gram-positive bacteria)]MBH0120953.1 DUF1990 domain-containing protein [Rhodococcus sp. CX]MCK8670546.1 DUF1990 domain-containing protein [Rhodococcus sp. HM1]